MSEINLQLLPETRKRIEVHTRGENFYFVGSIVLVVIVASIYFALYFYNASITSNIQSVDRDLATLEQHRNKAAEDKLLTLYKKFKVVNPLLSSHYFWSDGLVRIEKLIQPQVQFKTFNTQVSDKTISIKAEAANYTVVARQLAAFLNDPVFSNIALNKVISMATGRVEFTMQFNFDPKEFLIKKQVSPLTN